MKTILLSTLGIVMLIASCQSPVEQNLFTESADIDLGKKVMSAYLAQDWSAYSGLYADTVKIWRNKNWGSDKGFTVQEYIEDHKAALEPVSTFSFENEIWMSIISPDGAHRVMFWGVWTGHNDLTDKDYEIPVHLVMLVTGNKIARQVEFFNSAEVALDMMALAQSEESETTE